MQLTVSRSLALLGVAVLASVAPLRAAAHPHVWVTGRTEIVFSPGGAIAALKHRWTFDEMFSTMASQGLDADGDGTLTRGELEPLAEINVTSLREFDFFTYMVRDGEDVAFSQPVDYWLDHAGGKLTLNFTLPLKTPVTADKTVEITVYDPTYFVDFGFAGDDPVTASGAPPGCAVALTGKPRGPDIAAAPPGLLQSKPDFVPAPDFAAGFAQTIRVQCK